ncbi:hypothetical protein [uncultured Eubacterium sp.]|uniref:hypothetical protein n=1 Tax=uncultured Eubacterium sp. TaxID=165185 RepID=UPI00261CFAAA|nr:hypothetical protein [uncultured Eubacterium sp.]
MKLDKRLVALINSKAGSGGSGVTEDTVTTMITAAINSLIDSAPEEYDTLGKIAAKLLLTDGQIQTIMTQVADRYTKEETNELVSKIPKFAIEVVTVLPAEDISATTVYLKTGAKSDPDNIYDEYIYVNSKWELLGTQKIDLTNFYTKEETGDLLNNKVDKVSGKGLSTNDYTTAEKNKLAGIAAGANKTIVDSALSTTSTNTIQNKAVGLKFQDVDSEISGINSVLNSTADEIATIVNEYGSKNLLNSSLLANSTTNGITRENNGDGSITYTGTSTLSNDILAPLMASQTLKPGTYIFSANATISTSYSYQIYKNKTYWKGINITKPIEITESAAYTIGIVLGSKASINNTFKPMLRYAAIKNDTFVPYAMTNRELTEKVADTGWVEVDLSNTMYENTWCDVTKSKLIYRRFGDFSWLFLYA